MRVHCEKCDNPSGPTTRGMLLGMCGGQCWPFSLNISCIRALSPHRIYLVEISSSVVPVNGNDEGQTNSGFSCCYANGENRKHDPGECFGVWATAPECNEVEIGRIEHQFDSYENEDCVAPRQRTGETDG